jgi:lipase chaperone LimK
MKKNILLLLIMFGSFNLVSAQDNPNQQGEKVQALKIAFITQKLQLTSTEAEKFWPVYNQYENEIKSLRSNNQSGDVLENEEKLLNIRKKYKPSFEKIIGPEKVNQLFAAEKEFRNVLIKRLKNRNQQRF